MRCCLENSCGDMLMSVFCGEGSFWKVWRVGRVIVHSRSEKGFRCGIVEPLWLGIGEELNSSYING